MKEPLKIDSDLLLRYTKDQCTEEERSFVDAWYIAHAQHLPDVQLTAEELLQDVSDVWCTIKAATHPPKQSNTNWKRWFTTAAAIGIISFSSYYFLLHQPASIPIEENNTITTTTDEKIQSPVAHNLPLIQPAVNGAMLVLSTGEHITLNKNNNGSFNRRDQDILIDWSNTEQLVYHPGETKSTNHTTLTNTLIVPKGNTYKIKLADGTLVTLNADSKLTFPLQFSGTKREVTLQGEAYFEVSKHQVSIGGKVMNQKFIVHAEQNAIQVLGTKFNVKAYPEDKQNSFTLEEGSIALTNPANPAPIVLKPSQKIIQTGNEFELLEVNLSKDLSWKNGDFYFDSATVKEIMDQISRWYNIELEYLGPVNNQRYISTISRKKTLQQVLEILETTTGIKFDIRTKGKERRLMIIP